MELAGCSICAPGELVQDKSSGVQRWNLRFQHVKLNLEWRVKGAGSTSRLSCCHQLKNRVFLFTLLPSKKVLSAPKFLELGWICSDHRKDSLIPVSDPTHPSGAVGALGQREFFQWAN